MGLCLLIDNQIAGTSLSKTLKAMRPMLLIAFVALMLITYVPGLTTWLPALIQ